MNPTLAGGSASPCVWQLVNNDELALPRTPDRLWVCGLGWDLTPLTGKAASALVAEIVAQRMPRGEDCPAVGTPRHAVFFGRGTSRTGVRATMVCVFAGAYRAERPGAGRTRNGDPVAVPPTGDATTGASGTWWFDGKQVWQDDLVVRRWTPDAAALVVLRRLTGGWGAVPATDDDLTAGRWRGSAASIWSAWSSVTRWSGYSEWGARSCVRDQGHFRVVAPARGTRSARGV